MKTKNIAEIFSFLCASVAALINPNYSGELPISLDELIIPAIKTDRPSQNGNNDIGGHKRTAPEDKQE